MKKLISITIPLCLLIIQVSGQPRFGEADQYFGDRYYDQAKGLYQKALRNTNDSMKRASLLNKIGYCYLMERKYEEADSILKASLAWSRGEGISSVESWIFIGEIRFEKFEHSGALSFFEKAASSLVNRKGDIKVLCRRKEAIFLSITRRPGIPSLLVPRGLSMFI